MQFFYKEKQNKFDDFKQLFWYGFYFKGKLIYHCTFQSQEEL